MSHQAEIRRKLAAQVLVTMKSGLPPWRSPYSRGAPTNPLTGHKYTGINPLVLDAVADQRQYRSKYWATYRQWGKLNLHVQKRPAKYAEGEWGTNIINWHPFHKTVDKGDILKLERFHLIETHAVFNAEQVLGLTVGKYIFTMQLNEQMEIDYTNAESIVEATRANITHHSSVKMPRYDRPPEDRILLPPRSRFIDGRQYMATKFHELFHWAEWRTGWVGKPLHHGELVAEIGTGYLETELGLPHDADLTNHNKWLPTWIVQIEENPKYLFDAAAQAARAVDYLLGFTRLQEREVSVLQPIE